MNLRIRCGCDNDTLVRRIIETERLGEARKLPIDLYKQVLPPIGLQDVLIVIGL